MVSLITHVLLCECTDKSTQSIHRWSVTFSIGVIFVISVYETERPSKRNTKIFRIHFRRLIVRSLSRKRLDCRNLLTIVWSSLQSNEVPPVSYSVTFCLTHACSSARMTSIADDTSWCEVRRNTWLDWRDARKRLHKRSLITVIFLSRRDARHDKRGKNFIRKRLVCVLSVSRDRNLWVFEVNRAENAFWQSIEKRKRTITTYISREP